MPEVKSNKLYVKFFHCKRAYRQFKLFYKQENVEKTTSDALWQFELLNSILFSLHIWRPTMKIHRVI